MTKKEKTDLTRYLNMSYSDIIHNLYNNATEMKYATKLLSKEFNKTLKELRSHPLGEFSPAYQQIQAKGIKRLPTNKVYDLNPNDVMKQFWVSRNYLKSATGNLEGFLSYRQNISDRLGGRVYTSNDEILKKIMKAERDEENRKKKIERIKRKQERTEKKFWKIYDRLVSEFGGIIKEQASNSAQEMLSILMADKDISQNQNALYGIMQSWMYNQMYLTENKADEASWYQDILNKYGKGVYNKNILEKRRLRKLDGSENK